MRISCTWTFPPMRIRWPRRRGWHACPASSTPNPMDGCSACSARTTRCTPTNGTCRRSAWSARGTSTAVRRASIIVAVIDTGVAYKDEGEVAEAPEFEGGAVRQPVRLRLGRSGAHRSRRARHAHQRHDRPGHQQQRRPGRHGVQRLDHADQGDLHRLGRRARRAVPVRRVHGRARDPLRSRQRRQGHQPQHRFISAEHGHARRDGVRHRQGRVHRDRRRQRCRNRQPADLPRRVRERDGRCDSGRGGRLQPEARLLLERQRLRRDCGTWRRHQRRPERRRLRGRHPAADARSRRGQRGRVQPVHLLLRRGHLDGDGARERSGSVAHGPGDQDARKRSRRR